MASVVRERICGSKVRTGCSTCKARHLKCSEERPACRRCEASGRACKYEETKPRRRPDEFTFVNYAAEASVAPLQPPNRDWQEERAFAFFRQRTAHDLEGPVEPVFFTDILLAVAEEEPAVRHAVSALGALHEVYGNLETQHLPQFAFTQYGKAIKGVLELQASSNPQVVEVTLISCILFSLLESMRGFHHASMSHLIAGLNVFRESYESGRFDLQNKSNFDRSLYWLFIRIDNQLMDVGSLATGGTESNPPVYDASQVSMPREFHSVGESMFQIDLLYNRVMYVLGKWELMVIIKGQTDSITHGWFKDRAHHILELERFHTAHRRMLARSHPSGFEKHQAGLLAISLASKTIAILLQVDDYVHPEKDFDKGLGIFRAMVEESEAFIDLWSVPEPAITTSATQQRSKHDWTREGSLVGVSAVDSYSAIPFRRASKTLPQRPILTMTSGCVLPLYFVAARCRHGPTRHSALQLLRKCNRREGLWDSNLSAGLAEKLIIIEEAKAKALLLAQQNQETLSLRERHKSIASPSIHVIDRSSIHDSALEERETTSPRQDAVFQAEHLPIPREARVRTVVMHYSSAEGQQHRGKAEFSMQPPWSVVPESGETYPGLASIEQVGFGTPGPRTRVDEVVINI